MTVPLINTNHYKILVRPTLVAHEYTRRLWREFTTTVMTTVPSEIGPDSVLPAQDVAKEFVRWLGIALQGRIDVFVKKSTVRRHIKIFFALWRHYAYTVVPSGYRTHLMAYFDSLEFKTTSTLTTKMRDKQTADFFDLELIIKAILEDVRYFRTNRARVSMTYVVNLCAESSERPGAILESGCYRASNEALKWRDHQFWVVPNPALPKFPLVCLILTATLLKGYRADESFTKPFFLLVQPASHRHVDLLMYAFALAFEDDIFEHIKTIDEVFCPEFPPTKAHRLIIKPSCLDLPVIRKEVYDGKRWINSPNLAMPYHTAAGYLRKISLSLGFPEPATFYVFRRLAAKGMQAALTESERKRMMGHNPGSDQFQAAYEARLAPIDLGSILTERLESSEENVLVMKALTGMSKDRDPNAPISLDAREENELLADEELVGLRVEKAKLRLRIEEARRLPDPTPEEETAAQDLIVQLVGQIRDLDRRHQGIVSRETRALILLKRKKYFADASLRQLTGKMPAQRVPLMSTTNVLHDISPVSTTAAPGKENRSQRAPAPPPRPLSDPMTDALDIIYNFTVTADDDGGDSSDAVPIGTAHFLASVNALLGLPERAPKMCYPGQSPTLENKCPMCDVEMILDNVNSGGGNVATHLHACYTRELRNMAQKDLDDAYEPTTCSWSKCKVGKTVWATRADYCEHLDVHLRKLRYPLQGTVPSCKWETSGVACGETDYEDVEAHFAQAHLLNVCGPRFEPGSNQFCSPPL
ncbi:hypothetical protein K438DRAFT_2011414 [Mycena galopus ATCC 62051]|nr:hypothetical protein K438DRAFT_2011414 [Mycena galopus ATCC 62051]